MNEYRGMLSKILIVGLGSIGKRHLRIARALYPNADIRVLRHAGPSATPEFADGCLVDMADALRFAPDAAVIANPAPFHLGTALPLARAGIHLLIEKPLAAESMGVQELLEEEALQRTVVMVGYNLRHLPSLQAFRQLLNEGNIGPLWSVRAETGQYLPSWRPGADYRDGVSAQRRLGGGVLLELSHEIDYLRWIFGEICWVQATLRRQSSLEIDVEDTAHLLLGFGDSEEGGGLTARLDMDFIRRDSTRQCIALGKGGSLRWDGLAGTVDVFGPEMKSWRNVRTLPHERDDSYISQWHHFAACILRGERPLVSAVDGAVTLAVIEAARRSSQDGGRRTIVNRSETP